MHKRIFYQVQRSGWLPHPFSQTPQAHKLYHTTTTAFKHNTNQKQVKSIDKIPQQKIIFKIFIDFNFFLFSAMGKEYHIANASKPKVLEH